jgi:hypothetical protein
MLLALEQCNLFHHFYFFAVSPREFFLACRDTDNF